MTQQQYLQWMANICGDHLESSANSQDWINWARGKGMNPAGGWQLNAKLTKEVVAHTIVQLLNLAPRKGNFDAVRILEREGIFITATGGFVTLKNFVGLIDSGFSTRVRPGWGNGDDNHEHTGPPGRDDDDGPAPTPTKPGWGYGDKNHEHTGPPGLNNQPNGSQIGSKNR